MKLDDLVDGQFFGATAPANAQVYKIDERGAVPKSAPVFDDWHSDVSYIDFRCLGKQ